MREIEVEFTKIVGEGKALGRKNGKIVFSYGVLPGEVANIKIVKEKKNFIEGEVINVIQNSPYRLQPFEEHYLSCSPWQIMNYELQVKSKRSLIEEFLYQTTKENIKLDFFYSAEKLFGYRTKIEYSFTEIEGKLFFAFHKRGDYSTKVPLYRGCALIDEKINNIALKILEKLNKKGIKKEQLKTLVFRKSEKTLDILACLYVKDENFDISFNDIEGLTGFVLVYSNPVSSISCVDKILKIEGKEFISEKIGEIDIQYSFDSFFQNNINLFEKAIEEIKLECANSKKIVDLYCGVGVIGFALKDRFEKLISIESNENSIKYAKINAEKNSLKNCEIIYSPAEKISGDLLTGIDTVILDPPRAGLHKNLIKNILKNLPHKIIYLSCNPITQGRDALYFLEKYKISKTIGFDFYPNTPHIENLLVFERK